jgi:hypothetical protein
MGNMRSFNLMHNAHTMSLDKTDKCLLCNHAYYGLKMSELEGHNRKVSSDQIWSSDALQITPAQRHEGKAYHSGVVIKNPDILKHFVIMDTAYPFPSEPQSDIEVENFNKEKMILKNGTWVHEVCYKSLFIKKIFLDKDIINVEECVQSFKKSIKKKNSFFGIIGDHISGGGGDKYYVESVDCGLHQIRGSVRARQALAEKISTIALGMDYADNEVSKQELELFIMINEVLLEAKYHKDYSLFGSYHGYHGDDVADRCEKRVEALLSSLKAKAPSSGNSDNSSKTTGYIVNPTMVVTDPNIKTGNYKEQLKQQCVSHKEEVITKPLNNDVMVVNDPNIDID